MDRPHVSSGRRPGPRPNSRLLASLIALALGADVALGASDALELAQPDGDATRADGAPFAFAGLWERWTAAATGAGLDEGDEVETVTIVTTLANDKLRPIHARMPVILPPEAFDDWLDPANDPAVACALLIPRLSDIDP